MNFRARKWFVLFFVWCEKMVYYHLIIIRISLNLLQSDYWLLVKIWWGNHLAAIGAKTLSGYNATVPQWANSKLLLSDSRWTLNTCFFLISFFQQKHIHWLPSWHYSLADWTPVEEIYSSGVRSANNLQPLDLKEGHQYSSPRYSHRDNMPHYNFFIKYNHHGPLSLTWIKFNPCTEK